MLQERTAPQTVTFKDWVCTVVIRTKPNQNIVIQLFDHETGEAVATATAGMGDVLPSNFVYVKDYTENEGMLDALTEGGIVSKPDHYVNAGFVKIPVCELLV